MTPAEWKAFLDESEITEADVKMMIDHLNKRFRMFLLLSFIPLVNLVTAGCAVYCYNNLNWWKSKGDNTGNNLVRFIIMLLGGIIPPFVEVMLFARMEGLSNKVLGF